MKHLLSIVLLGVLATGCQTTGGGGGGGNTNANINTNQNANTDANVNQNANANVNVNANENLNANANDNTSGATFDVSIDQFTFTPKSITIHVGDTVIWTNNHIGIPHTVTNGNPGDADAGAVFDSGTLDPGDEFILPFTEAGTFVYFCRLHADTPSMRDATVIVEP